MIRARHTSASLELGAEYALTLIYNINFTQIAGDLPREVRVIILLAHGAH